ncbi:hypothetical protein ADK64_16760 [Streptomyces sp. MMG1121]|nr:hypothetical protein ADK64_16760 [Streptomyces sp. MMG1121]
MSVALLVAGCVRPGVKEARMGVEVYLQPAASQGPEPFTDSTATAPRARDRTGSADPTAPPAAGTTGPAAPRPPGSGVRTAVTTAGVGATAETGIRPLLPVLPAAPAIEPLRALRAVSGGTPGLYSGTAHVAGCDVERQIRYLTADRDRGGAFAQVVGVSATGLPGYLRALTPVVLRADTRVTGHGYRDRQAVDYQAVLQAGTAVLVDNRGVPRLRCACGNPLGLPVQGGGGLGARGTAWSGYTPSQVIAVTPAPRAITRLTLVDVEARTWVERPTGHDVSHDHVVPAPAWATALPQPDQAPTAPMGTAPPYSLLPSPYPSTVTPSATAGPGRRRTPPPTGPATAPVAPGTRSPGTALPQSPPPLDLTLDAPYDTGPPGD